MEDLSIILSCLSGNREAFSKIVKKYQGTLLAMSYGILGNHEEAREVTQETFMKTYASLNKFDQKKSFRTWLFSIAYKSSIDKIRKNKRRDMAIRRWKESGSPHHQMDDTGLVWEDDAALMEMFSSLNSKERTVLLLNIFSGFSLKEISEIIGCPNSTVRVYAFNARRKIKKSIEDKNYV